MSPADQDGPPDLTAHRTSPRPDLDGRLAAECWRDVPWSPRFVDLVSGGRAGLDTRAAILWDDDALYVGFRLEEPRVEATLTERDAHIWLDDDVEVLVAGPDRYYELEVNALGTVYEVLFEWDDAPRDRSTGPAALRVDHPRAAPFDGVDFDHPRGARTGFWGWDLPGLVTAVHVDGALNDPAVVDRGWSVEIALPWAGLAVLAGEGQPVPPRDGDVWRIALARFNTDRLSPDDSGGWALRAHGVWDAHIPERFPRIRFSTDPARPPSR